MADRIDIAMEALAAMLQAEAMIDRIAAIKTALLGLHRTVQ